MSSNSSKLVVGNWKMNATKAFTETLLPEIVSATRGAAAEVALCLPFPFLETASRLLRDTSVAWGAQDVSDSDSGAYTGQVSASMLKDFGCQYIIVGHSERRVLLRESDDLGARKARATLRVGLMPIFCVGESLSARESGQTEEVVLRQLDSLLTSVSIDQLSHCVVAYEPVWAIGTGRTATPEQAQDVHAAIRHQIAAASPNAEVRILYGGSVTSATARSLFAQADIDGALVGGASLVAWDFAAIVAAASGEA